MRNWFLLFSLLLSLAFTQSACDLREGTLVYDVDFHPANANAGTEGSSRDGAATSRLSTNSALAISSVRAMAIPALPRAELRIPSASS